MRLPALFATFTSALLLAACQGEAPDPAGGGGADQPGGSDAGDLSQPAAGGEGAMEPPVAPETSDAIFSANELATEMSAPENMAVDFFTDRVRIFGGMSADEANSSGSTQAARIRLPGRIERNASGGRVRVTVSARQAEGGAGHEFAIAYSTREVGDSGWRRFELSDAFRAYVFEYDVPEMVEGDGDYIGVLPDASGASGVIEIDFIAIEVVGAGASE